jgi:hypothetical protein
LAKLIEKEERMKKLVFILAVAGVLIGGTFAAAVLAAPPVKPLGAPVLMETDGDRAEVEGTTSLVQADYFPQIRHVSLTYLLLRGMDAPGDRVCLRVWFRGKDGSGQTWQKELVPPMPPKGVTLEFDTCGWDIYVDNKGGAPIVLYYQYSVTYPKP